MTSPGTGKPADALATGKAGWHAVADVIVVGAGLAGYCAALEAADCGASVLLLEKQSEAGGTSRLSGGAIAFAGTDGQRAQRIEDSPQRLLADLRKVSGGTADNTLLETYAARQLDCYRWLQGLGVRFGSVQQASGQSVPRSNRVDAGQMMLTLAERATAHRNISIENSCAAARLVRMNTGRVSGIVAARQAKPAAFEARRGVILCSGGFSRSETLLRLFAPGLVSAQKAGAEGCTGDGLQIARALGAGLKDMGNINSTFGRHVQATPEEIGLLHPIYKGAIAVNRNGRRFADESRSYKTLGAACLRQPEALAYQIFDREIMAQSLPEAATSNFAGALKAGRVLEAPDLAALAECLGLGKDTLAATVEEYNLDAAAGRDRLFGRTSLANGNGQLRQIVAAPFYAYPCTTAVLGTYCGLAVDGEARVIDVHGEPIPGLYAAGEITGGFHGTDYMTGTALGKAAVFGRIAGQSVARQAPAT